MHRIEGYIYGDSFLNDVESKLNKEVDKYDGYVIRETQLPCSPPVYVVTLVGAPHKPALNECGRSYSTCNSFTLYYIRLGLFCLCKIYCKYDVHLCVSCYSIVVGRLIVNLSLILFSRGVHVEDCM